MTPTTPEKKTGQLTAYKILKRTRAAMAAGTTITNQAITPGNETWEVVASVSARSSDAAVRAHVDKTPDPDGTYAAIPERSFAPVTVTVSQKTVVTIA